MKTLIAGLAAMLLAGCSDRAAERNEAVSVAVPAAAPADPPVVAASPTPAPVDPYSPKAAEGVARTFLTRAAAGDRADALAQWRGDPAAGQAVIALVAAYGAAPVSVDRAIDPDAGAGQRYITVPFRIGKSTGKAILHRVSEGIDADDPSVHDWHVSDVELAPAATVGTGDPAAGAAPDPGTSATSGIVTAVFDCDDGSVPTVRFDNRAGTAAVMLSGTTILLDQQRSGSGIRYARNGSELRGKGRAATIVLNGAKPKQCVSRD